MTPRVSILIPNFNNGKASSQSGELDLIGELLQSLYDTLADDPTPCEILVCDDGSTDDSLATLRAWAQRKWPDGRPFLELMEVAHTGKLSGNANRLYRRAAGDILVRLDGDILCLTPGWARRLVRYFEEGPPRLGIIGPKQLGVDGRIHAYGDFLLHPSGYVHVAHGFERQAVQHPLEVDHTMGCFYCCRRQVYDEVGGYDESFYRSETEDFGVAARLKGWRCFAVPDIEFVHRHKLRKNRPSKYDDMACVLDDIAHFEKKWGFSRLGADLKAVRRQYAGTPLLWNAAVFPAQAPVLKEPPEPVRFETSDWARFVGEAPVRRRVEVRCRLVVALLRQMPRSEPVVQVGCGTGLVAHLMATAGLAVLGLDPHAANLELARRCTAGRAYPARAPAFLALDHPDRLPLADGSAGVVLICDFLEHHPNPVALVREAQRVLAKDGFLVILTPEAPRAGDPSDPAPGADPLAWHPYSGPDLANQVGGLGHWIPVNMSGPPTGTDDLITIMRKSG